MTLTSAPKPTDAVWPICTVAHSVQRREALGNPIRVSPLLDQAIDSGAILTGAAELPERVAENIALRDRVHRACYGLARA